MLDDHAGHTTHFQRNLPIIFMSQLDTTNLHQRWPLIKDLRTRRCEAVRFTMTSLDDKKQNIGVPSGNLT